MRVLLFVVVLVALAGAFASATSTTEEEDLFKFHQFLAKYRSGDHEMYQSDDDFQFRFAVFRDNLRAMERSRERNPLATFDVNKFSDMSRDELRERLTNSVPPADAAAVRDQSEVCKPKGPMPASDAKDWRDEGIVTAVKDQGQCGSCWAFSTTESVESATIQAGKGTVDTMILSEQQLVDCDGYAYGCGGGWTYDAMQYLINAGGQESEAAYPYTAEDGTCEFNKQDVMATISDYCYSTKNSNETEMLQYVTTTSVQSVCLATGSWFSYSGGILTGDCGTSVDHCVQVVGSGTDESSGTPYWIVRNSWGTDWGMSGYIYIERNINLCMIAEYPISPLV